MSSDLIFSLIATSIMLWSHVLWWVGMYRGQIIPHPFTMLVWSVVLFITTYEYISRAEWMAFIPTFLTTMSCIGAFIIGVLRFRSIRINWVDWVFLAMSILLMTIWILSTEYRTIIPLVIAIDAFAYASSFKKAWIQPMTEKYLPYFVSSVGNFCTVFSVTNMTFENIAVWSWTAGINLTFACFILARQYYQRK